MRLIITGAPGAGKGTQSTRIAERYGVPAISTGSIFRHHLAAGTELGKQVQAIMDAGQLVSDEVTDALVADRLNQDDTAHGWLLDGYPRNVHQVGALDALLAQQGQQIDAVISLVVDSDEVVNRLLKRSEVEGRSDDTPDTIRKRLEVFERETAPVLGEYQPRGLVVEVPAMGTVDEVTERIFAALAKHAN